MAWQANDDLGQKSTVQLQVLSLTPEGTGRKRTYAAPVDVEGVGRMLTSRERFQASTEDAKVTHAYELIAGTIVVRGDQLVDKGRTLTVVAEGEPEQPDYIIVLCEEEQN